MIYAISPIKYGDNERSILSGIVSRGISRMSSKRVQWHVWEAKHMKSLFRRYSITTEHISKVLRFSREKFFIVKRSKTLKEIRSDSNLEDAYLRCSLRSICFSLIISVLNQENLE